MKSSFFLLASSVFFLTGCSVTIRDTLGYTPVIEQQEKNHISLRIEEFEDARLESQQIGQMKNLCGITVFKITTGEDVPSWIQEALRVELGHAGYFIVDFSDDYSIEGKINKVFADAYFNIDACVSIEISLKKDEEILFHKNYEFRNSEGIRFLDEKSNVVEYATATETLKHNLQEVCKRVIIDIDQYFLNHGRYKSMDL